jgi:glycosyltransferase involved in cell wall biosynthesis
MRTFVIVPAYNEEARIGAVVRAVRPLADRVIVVDDGSVDRTADAAAAAGARVVSHVINRGQGAALRTGTAAALAADAEVIVHFDGDGQHGAGSIEALIAPIRDGRADVVYGSRFMGVKSVGMPVSRRVLLWGARLFSTLVLGIPRSFTDPQSGLRAMSAAAARDIRFTQDRMAHCSELLRNVSRSGYRAIEVPVKVLYTDETLSKGQKAVDALRIVWQLVMGAFQR